MEATIGGDAAKIGNNTHFVVVIRVRLLQKIGLLDLTNQTQFKRETDIKYIQKLCSITRECV